MQPLNISEPDSPELLKLVAKIVSSIGQLLGNILNQGNTAATLPEDAMSSKRRIKAKKKAGQQTQNGQLTCGVLVAGAGFEPTTFGL